MNSRVLDRNWPWQLLAATIFVVVLSGLRFIIKGPNEDFGWGFGLGLMVGYLIALTAVGWRRGEHRPATETEQYPQHRP